MHLKHLKFKKSVGTILLTVFFLNLDAAEPPIDALRQKALQNDASSQYVLGTEYFFGKNTRKRNPHLALYWFGRAASQKHPEALYNLAACHEYGWGTPVNPARAYFYYTQAANQKLPEAQLRRALLLLHGVTEADAQEPQKFPAIPANPVEAIKIMRQLAQRGFIPARLELAKRLLQKPQEWQKHAAEIRQWLAEVVATPTANPEIWKLYAMMLREGWGGIADFAQARRYFQKALPDSGALFNLAQMTEFGEGGRPDPRAAVKLYQQAAELKHSGAQLRLGELYLAGDYLPHDPVRAWQLLKKAAQQREPHAFYHLGRAYLFGVGLPLDLKHAVLEFERGARLGDRDCQYELAQALFKGQGTPPNSDSALFWLKRSAASGHEAAIRELAERLIEGRGITRNAPLGYRLLKTLETESE